MHSTEDLNCTASLDDLYYLQFHSFQRACAESCRRKFPNIPPAATNMTTVCWKWILIDLHFTLYTASSEIIEYTVHACQLEMVEKTPPSAFLSLQTVKEDIQVGDVQSNDAGKSQS